MSYSTELFHMFLLFLSFAQTKWFRTHDPTIIRSWGKYDTHLPMLKIISELFAPKCGSIKFAKYLEGFYNIDPCYSNFNHSLRSSFNEEKVFTFFSPLKLPVIADAKNVQKEQKNKWKHNRGAFTSKTNSNNYSHLNSTCFNSFSVGPDVRVKSSRKLPSK